MYVIMRHTFSVHHGVCVNVRLIDVRCMHVSKIVLLVVFTSIALLHLFVVVIVLETGRSPSLSTSVTSQGIPQQMDTSPMVCT